MAYRGSSLRGQPRRIRALGAQVLGVCSLLCVVGGADGRTVVTRGKLTVRVHGRNIPKDHVEFPPLRLAGDGRSTEVSASSPPASSTETTTGQLLVPTPSLSVAAPAPSTAAAEPPASPPPAGEATATSPPPASPPPANPSPANPSAASEPTPALACRPEPQASEATIRCTDGKTWTMRSAGLILPPVLRCSSKHPECCQIGFRKMRDVQLADLLRVGEGLAPVCYMRVGDFLVNPPSPAYASSSYDRLDDELPPGLRRHKDCPKGRYLALGTCHDPSELLRALRPPAIVDRNRMLVPEASDVVERMRRDFDATGKCPQSALDIDVLKRIYDAAQLRLQLVADTPLDVEPLLALASAPGGTAPEPQLAASCGYNATYKQWFQTTFHCATQKTCFAQSHQSLPHTCAQFQRATTESGTSPYFWPWANCQNVPFCSAVSSASIECTGVARLTALGRGVFLMIQEDTTAAPYYYGVLFARPRPRSDAEKAAASRARSLLADIARNLPSAGERDKLHELLSTIPE